MQSPYVWEFEMDESQFSAILEGNITLPGMDQDWAAVRLLEYAPYGEIVQRLGFKRIINGWPQWREKIKDQNRQRGFEFLASWLPRNYPDLVK